MTVIRNLSRASLSSGFLLCAITASTATTIQVEVNGRPLSFSVPPTTIQNRTMVPLRGVFESLDAQVTRGRQPGQALRNEC